MRKRVFRKDNLASFLAIATFLLIFAGLAFAISPKQKDQVDPALPRVLWKAKVLDGFDGKPKWLENGNIAVNCGYRGYQVFNAKGKSVSAKKNPEDSGLDEDTVAFLDDGSKVTVSQKSYRPAVREGNFEITLSDPSGKKQWATTIPRDVSMVWSVDIGPEGIVIYEYGMHRMESGGAMSAYWLSCYSLEGTELWSRLEGLGNSLGETALLKDGDFIAHREGNISRYNSKDELLWEYQSWGYRNDFEVFENGSSYALLQAPERLIKVNADGQVEWECNITEHAAGKLNHESEKEYFYGDFITEGPDGTLFVCDGYNALTAISGDGQYLWSVTETKTVGDRGEELVSPLDFNANPSVAPDGTVFLQNRKNSLKAISPEGEVLFVDSRFADVVSPPAYNPDGTVYIVSGGWLYALDLSQPARKAVLREQEDALEAERLRIEQRDAEYTAELQASRERQAAGRMENWERRKKNWETRTENRAKRGLPPEDPPEKPNEELYEIEADPSPVRTPFPPGDGIADRTVVAAEIIPALLKYYGAEGEFPPFLLGVEYAEDPLIAGGYLEGYPRVWPQPPCECCQTPAVMDKAGYERWINAVSIPGAAAMAIGDTSHIDGEHHCGRVDFMDYKPQKTRNNCLSIPPVTHNSSAWSYFGYQRGEWLGSSEQEAWLWFYGSNIWPELNNPIPASADDYQADEYYDLFRKFSKFGSQGFDLLNDETGELIPDGRRDGICLLYKLADGKLVEVIRADGI